ncbi:MAG TPA: protein translocase subunit SecD [Nitrospiria bacterium]|nr:protein translocase subunit SecD [Nitrospiria bacterium]
MKKGIKTRSYFIALTVLVSIVFFLPSTPAYKYMPEWWKTYLPNKGINLGLDLRGGIHLVLEVEEEKAVENVVERAAINMKEFLNEKKVQIDSIRRSGPAEITVVHSQSGTKDEVSKLTEGFPNFTLKDSKEGETVLVLREGEAKRIKESASAQALETIRNRIDQYGVTEPLIQKQAENQIVVQLPGIKEPGRAKELIGKTAILEFKLLDEESPLINQLPQLIPSGDEEKTINEFKDKIPDGDEILFDKIVNAETGKVAKRPYLVKKRTMVSGDLLTDARVSIGEFNEAFVSITFDSAGARLFDMVTAENVNKHLAIILDGNIYSAPRINERISGGKAQITGSFTTNEANDLAIALRAGALPAPVRIIQDVTVGPTLGGDSIRMGIKAGIIGTIAVIAIMAIFYRLSGVIAIFALGLNIILLIGALAALNATLTLPGIAGIILTIGMSVDSNVLIFERIREELRQGKPVRLAIDAGYDKAFLTIIDSHVTTLITALVLFLFGTGPIKGFAVSLSLGVTINLFTAIVGTKVVFDFINSLRKMERLSI